MKNKITIEFNTIREKNGFQAKIANFMDNKKIKTKNEAYKKIMNFGFEYNELKNIDRNIFEMIKELKFIILSSIKQQKKMKEILESKYEG